MGRQTARGVISLIYALQGGAQTAETQAIRPASLLYRAVVQRVRRLAAFWSWLPAFRAVAESEHLPTASKRLNITASSLSRTIRLLEDEIGTQLFDRAGRQIRLNDTGAAFLQATREAMRVVHEALLVASGDQHRGPVHCCAPSPFAPIFLVPATRWLSEEHPSITVHIHNHGSLSARLRRGQLDVALSDDAIEDEGIVTTRIMDLEHDVFVSSKKVTLENAIFVAPTLDERGQTPDAWPADRKRTIGLRVDLMQVAIDVVRSGAPYAAVLPVIVGKANGLTPLGLADEMSPSVLYMVRRSPLALPSRADLFADAVLATLPKV